MGLIYLLLAIGSMAALFDNKTDSSTESNNKTEDKTDEIQKM